MKKIKQLIVFDLAATLLNGNAVIDAEMASLLNKLLEVAKVAIIANDDWPVFEKQLLPGFLKKEYLKNLVILPVNGTRYYQYRTKWTALPIVELTSTVKDNIKASLLKAIDTCGINTEKILGEQFEFIGSDITFSALGKQATAKEKEDYDPDQAKRKMIKTAFDEALFDYSVKIEGPDLIVISKTGMDKAHGIYLLHQILGIKTRKILFIGKELLEGGNNNSALTTGAECIQVNDTGETKKVTETIIACLSLEHKKKHESV